MVIHRREKKYVLVFDKREIVLDRFPMIHIDDGFLPGFKTATLTLKNVFDDNFTKWVEKRMDKKLHEKNLIIKFYDKGICLESMKFIGCYPTQIFNPPSWDEDIKPFIYEVNIKCYKFKHLVKEIK